MATRKTVVERVVEACFADLGLDRKAVYDALYDHEQTCERRTQRGQPSVRAEFMSGDNAWLRRYTPDPKFNNDEVQKRLAALGLDARGNKVAIKPIGDQ